MMGGVPPGSGSRHVVAELLGDPDEAVLRMARNAQIWIALNGTFLLVVLCFVLGKYPVARTATTAALLFGVLPFVVVLALRDQRGESHRWVGGVLLWTCAVQNMLTAAITGGLRSPHLVATFMIFASLWARYGWCRAGHLVFGLFGSGVLWMAVVPRDWTGPALADPWFTLAASISAVGSLAVQAQFVRALRQTAATAVAETLRARDELAEHALARARELELVGSKLSHELNNPLSAIKGLVQVAHRSSRDPAIVKQLGVVECEIERMSFIVQSHLSFSRPLDRFHPVDVELAEVADSVLALLEGRAKTAAVSLDRKGRARALVDPKWLRSALLNLVANAIDACQRGGRVAIVLDDNGATVRASVVDDGCGMMPDVLQRLGRPFFTTRDSGTGLGVVLARAAFEQHGGTLEYRSVPGQGTTVVGTLPRAQAA